MLYDFRCLSEWQSKLALRSCTGHIECYNHPYDCLALQKFCGRHNAVNAVLKLR